MNPYFVATVSFLLGLAALVVGSRLASRAAATVDAVGGRPVDYRLNEAALARIAGEVEDAVAA